MRRLIGYVRWRFRSGGRRPLAYRVLAGVLVHRERTRRDPFS
jgi:hypothetical protein